MSRISYSASRSSDINRFSHTGSVQFMTIPFDVTSIRVYMWGGGGYQGAGAYVEGIVHVYPGCTLNITVAGAGSWNTGVGCGGSNHECYEEGGKSALQISGEDMPILIAKGGRGRSPPYSSSQSSPSYTDTVRHTLYKSLSSSRSGSIDSGGCNGQHSKYYNHAVCGRGGSRASQNGLVIIELDTSSSIDPTTQPVPSIMPTIAPSGQPSNTLSPSNLIMVVALVTFVSVITLLLFFCMCGKYCVTRDQRLPNAVTQYLPDEPLSAIPMATVTVVSSNIEESLPRSGFMMVDPAERDCELSLSKALHSGKGYWSGNFGAVCELRRLFDGPAQIDSFLDHFQYSFTFDEKLLSSSHPPSEADISSFALKGYIDACNVIFNDLARRLHKSGPVQSFASLEDVFAALQIIDKPPYFQINVANVYFKTVHFLLSELMAWKLRRKTKPSALEPAEEEGTIKSMAHLNKICSILNIPAVSPAIGGEASGRGEGNVIELPDRSLVGSILSAMAAHSAAAERSTEPILAHRLDVTVQSFLLSKNLTDESREELRKKVEEQRQQLDMHDVPEYQAATSVEMSQRAAIRKE
eukprot:gene27329-36084_t